MKSFDYSRTPEIGKAYIRMHLNHYNVYVYTHISETGTGGDKIKTCYSLDEARYEQAMHNDWQCLGVQNEYVYRGNDIFNKAFDVQPWEHLYISDDKLFFFIWDTRELTKVAKRPANLDAAAIKQYLHKVVDNGKPITYRGRWLSRSQLLAMPITYRTAKQIANNE